MAWSWPTPKAPTAANPSTPLFGLGGADPKNPGQTAQDAILSRLLPLQQQQRTSAETQWTNQGLRPGGEAYDNAANLLGQQENDARQQAVLSGLNLDLDTNQQSFDQWLQQQQLGLQGQQVDLQGQQLNQQNQQYQQGVDAAQHNSTISGLFGLGASVGAPVLGGLLGNIGKGAGAAAGAAAPAVADAVGGAGAAASAGAPATGITGALGLGGGAGLFGLGAATIPVIGGAIAGIGLLAKKFFGNGGDRRAANELTGANGVHEFFNQATQQVEALPPGPERDAAADARDRQFEEALIAFSKRDKDHYYQAKNTLQQFSKFSSVRPLLG